jgi:hypothetical protein
VGEVDPDSVNARLDQFCYLVLTFRGRAKRGYDLSPGHIHATACLSVRKAAEFISEKSTKITPIRLILFANSDFFSRIPKKLFSNVIKSLIIAIIPVAPAGRNPHSALGAKVG